MKAWQKRMTSASDLPFGSKSDPPLPPPIGIAGGIIQIVAVALLWGMLNVVGVFDQVTQIVSSTGLDAGGFDLTNVFSLGTVLSAVTIFSIVEVVLITVLVVIFTLLYNVVSTLVGGIHVTLGDD